MEDSSLLELRDYEWCNVIRKDGLGLTGGLRKGLKSSRIEQQWSSHVAPGSCAGLHSSSNRRTRESWNVKNCWE
ncbi:hypothetical protein TWF173_005787 [Orbilia oligospora]|nr:hypothetical protein TWF173_005787 [Orbilia oligospora]